MNGHSLFKMDSTNPDDMIDVSIKNVNVTTANDFTISTDQSGGILSVGGFNGINKNIEIDNCSVIARTGDITISGRSSGGIMGCEVVADGGIVGGIGTVTITECTVTATTGTISSPQVNSGSIMGYNSLEQGSNINISDCCVRFCKEFNFLGLKPITYTLYVNNSNKEYVIRGGTINGGTIDVITTKIFSLCNFELGGTIQGISPQHLQTTQGGTARSNSRVILRRTGFSFNPNKPCQLQSGLYKDWNQNPKVPKASQGERIRFLKLLAKNKNYNTDKL